MTKRDKFIIKRLKMLKTSLNRMAPALVPEVDQIIFLISQPQDKKKRNPLRAMMRDYYRMCGGAPADRYDPSLYAAATTLMKGQAKGKSWQQFTALYSQALQAGVDPPTLVDYVYRSLALAPIFKATEENEYGSDRNSSD